MRAIAVDGIAAAPVPVVGGCGVVHDLLVFALAFYEDDDFLLVVFVAGREGAVGRLVFFQVEVVPWNGPFARSAVAWNFRWVRTDSTRWRKYHGFQHTWK